MPPLPPVIKAVRTPHLSALAPRQRLRRETPRSAARDRRRGRTFGCRRDDAQTSLRARSASPASIASAILLWMVSAMRRLLIDGYSPLAAVSSAHHCKWLLHSVSRLPTTAIIVWLPQPRTISSWNWPPISVKRAPSSMCSAMDSLSSLSLGTSVSPRSGRFAASAAHIGSSSCRRCRDRPAARSRSAATARACRPRWPSRAHVRRRHRGCRGARTPDPRSRGFATLPATTPG